MRPLGRSRLRWEENFSIDLKVISDNMRNWIDSVLVKDYWRAMELFNSFPLALQPTKGSGLSADCWPYFYFLLTDMKDHVTSYRVTGEYDESPRHCFGFLRLGYHLKSVATQVPRVPDLVPILPAVTDLWTSSCEAVTLRMQVSAVTINQTILSRLINLGNTH